MDPFEMEMRMELELCKVILKSIERHHNKSLRSQKVVPRCQKHLDILRQHQVEFNEHFDRKDLTDGIRRD